MTKRIVAIALLLMVIASAATFADTLGIGASFGVNENLGVGNALLSLKLPSVPFLLGVGLDAGQNTLTAAFTLDWWLYTTNLINFINLYVGPGLYMTLPDPLNLGIRVPIGLNAYPIPVFELFLEFAPTLGIISGNNVRFPNFGLQAALGFRFWFNI